MPIPSESVRQYALVHRALAVGVAGAAGAAFRYWIGLAIGVRSFPWATLGINVAGSFALGYVLAGPGLRWSATVQTAAAVGFLGAFTTYSTFSYETTTLLRTDRPVAAAIYVLASLVLGLAASGAGYAIGRIH